MCEISIVVPVYNKKDYIEDSVKSVLHQSFDDFEMLLIDDGSTDGSGRVCDLLSARDKRVKVFHTENRGVSAARNFGIKKAVGKYICFIDADDRIKRTFLEKLYNAIRVENAGLSVCGYYEIRKSKALTHNHKNYASGDRHYEAIRQNLLCILWNKLYVRKKIKHLFDEGISTCEDSLFCAWYYYDNDPKVAYVDEALYGYMVHGDGLTSKLQDGALCGINRFLMVNRLVSERIEDERLKHRAIHHAYIMYFYGVYLYIFETLGRGELNEDVLSKIEQVISNRKYRRVIRYIIKYPFTDIGAERITAVELFIISFSLLGMKSTIYIFSKVKKCLVP
ncbi:MAG: glycosyltransferase family 2 protein [Lachnospiraceae bacterium]|nr:glycosyltransferase family 2 protein [Lachnospiraceae bacterium]